MKQMKQTTSLPNTFGIGTQVLFGDTSAQPPPALASPSPHQDEGNNADDTETESASSVSEDELLTAMASATLAESPWTSAPSHPPIYLSTVSEYLPPPPKPKLPPGVKITDPLADDDRKGKDADISWAAETYEDSLEMDHVFERFIKRVGYENEQCVRQVFFFHLQYTSH
jgi:pre-rRNA-processing protein TSR4